MSRFSARPSRAAATPHTVHDAYAPGPSWVTPVNAAFTPTADLVAHNKRVREVFAEAVAAGTAAVPLDGRMIDVPVDEWAKVVLAMAEACDARDAQKLAALERRAGPSAH